MAKRLFITPLAKQDLEHIFHYGAREFGVESAVNFLAKFENAFSLLMDFDIGTACPDVKVGLFRYVVGRYVVFFFRSADEVRIVRILHGSRDVKNQFV